MNKEQEKQFDILDLDADKKGETCVCLAEKLSKNDYERIKQFISKIKAEQRKEIVEKIEEIDFYSWNENTQRMIKDKIKNLK